MVKLKNPDSNRRGFSLTVFNQAPSVCSEGVLRTCLPVLNGAEVSGSRI
jgi:hypothetical protein